MVLAPDTASQSGAAQRDIPEPPHDVVVEFTRAIHDAAATFAPAPHRPAAMLPGSTFAETEQWSSSTAPAYPSPAESEQPIVTPAPDAIRGFPTSATNGSTGLPPAHTIGFGDNIQRLTPTLIVQQSADALITDRVRKVLDALYGFLNELAAAAYVPVRKVEVTGHVDPETDRKTIVVRQWVALPPDPALAYWDGLSIALRDWVRSLPRVPAEIMDQRIHIEVRWDAERPKVRHRRGRQSARTA